MEKVQPEVTSARPAAGLAAYFLKMKTSARTPLKAVPINALWGTIGGTIAIAVLAYLTSYSGTLWIMAPFGASCVLAFGLYDAPLSQPRNIIGGHLVTTLVGLIMYHLFGNEPWVLGVAVGLGIGAMMMTKTTHPPAGANPIVVILAGSPWSFLFTPVLVGAVVIAVVALLFNNLISNRKYPTFWM